MARKSESKPKTSKKSASTRVTPENHELHKKLRDFIRTKGYVWLENPGVTSIGIGYKVKDEITTDEIAIQFTVEEKLTPEALAAQAETETIPSAIEVGGQMIPTDVIQRIFRPAWRSAEPEAPDVRKRRIDPLVPGVSVGHGSVSAGTLGLIVYDRATMRPLILSNWHVLNGGTGRAGDPIFQPGRADNSNTSGNICGKLLRDHIGPAGDCAVATIENRGFATGIHELGVTPSKMADVELDDILVKSGRTTGITFGKVRRVDVIARVSYAMVGPKSVGGFEIGIWENAPIASSEVSMGGDSGAVWMIWDVANAKATNVMAGLHFAGETQESADEHALACYPKSVTTKMEVTLVPATTAVEGRGLAGDLPRIGYDPNFLGLDVGLPGLTTALKRDAVNGPQRKDLIDYTHFSVCLSTARRLARYVAWNIDGARRVTVRGASFRLDPRIDADLQWGDELYADNPYDQGHLARRADLCWGSVQEAKQANSDSYYFTNIAPQHLKFNRSAQGGLWGLLENTVLEQADAQDIRASVFGGPIFKSDDPEYRGAKIPRSFWKTICYVGGSDGKLRAASFVLSQRELLATEDINFDPFVLYQVSIADLENETGLGLGFLRDADTLLNAELVSRVTSESSVTGVKRRRMREIRSTADLRM